MGSDERREYAQRVMSNPTEHYMDEPHLDVKPEWIEATIADPHHRGYDGSQLYFRCIDEMKHWLRVVVENDQLHTAYFDGRSDKVVGRLL